MSEITEIASLDVWVKHERFQVQIVDFGSIFTFWGYFQIDAGLYVDFMCRMLILASWK